MKDNEIFEKTYPTLFQKKVFWLGLACLSIVIIGAFFTGIIYLINRVLSYLQPILVPLAAAGIIAYLLDPLVEKLNRRGISRRRGFLIVYILFVLILILLGVLVILPSFHQISDLVKSGELAKLPDRVSLFISESRLSNLLNFFGLNQDTGMGDMWKNIDSAFKDKILGFSKTIFNYIGKGFSGLLGVFGYIIGIFLIPIYLYYFLKEKEIIVNVWEDYIPLKKSNFKNEIIETIREINSYLIAFFRGQMIVSILDGILVGLLLFVIDLKYAALIGLFVGILGIIPYIGNLLCLIPAIIIAIMQITGKKAEEMPWVVEYFSMPNWAFPLLVLFIFIMAQQVNSLFTAPRIVGNSVGLHPMTIIFSVLFWSLILGGLLGALLAVPLTASIKVIFRRYIWDKKINVTVLKE